MIISCYSKSNEAGLRGNATFNRSSYFSMQINGMNHTIDLHAKVRTSIFGRVLSTNFPLNDFRWHGNCEREGAKGDSTQVGLKYTLFSF